MKMMSVTESDVNWSWFSTFALLHLVTSTVLALVSTTLYEKSDTLLLWVFWTLTMIALEVFSMAIAALTSKTVRSILIGLLLFFAGHILSDVFLYDERSVSLIQVLSLHPVTVFTYGLNQIGSLESDGVGLTKDSMDFTENQSGYAFRNTFNMLLVDCVFWGVMVWYLNRVIPPDFGQALLWYFPLTKKYWFPSSANPPIPEHSVESANSRGIPYEPVSDALKHQTEQGQTIEINNLRKVFGEMTAVDGLSLSIYNGQITALLGHNGTFSKSRVPLLQLFHNMPLLNEATRIMLT